MADFSSTNQTLAAINMAADLLPSLRALYHQAKAVQTRMALYQANSNPAFNTAINTIFIPAQRTELADMLTDVNTLIADWEANHISALALDQ
jgi:hypothetical protein